jgi:hypothetical protein
MKSTAIHIAAVALGAVIGLGSAAAILNRSDSHGQFEYDRWVGNPDIGSSAAGPYTRASIAKMGLLALNREEAIYFHRYVDDRGERLREGCAYSISGGELPARWWSITIYAADNFLPVNGDAAHSIDASRIERQDDSSWTARLASERADAANWISTRNAGEFDLALRLYNAHESALQNPAAIPYPKVERLACDEVAP